MCPVLEDAARGEQVRDGLARVVADPADESDPVAPLDGRDRVELDARERADRRLDLAACRAPGAAGVALRRDGKPPNRRRAHRSLRHRGSIYDPRLPAGAAAAAARPRTRGRLRQRRAGDGARRGRLRHARDRSDGAAGGHLPPALLDDLSPRTGRSTPSSPSGRCTTSASSRSACQGRRCCGRRSARGRRVRRDLLDEPTLDGCSSSGGRSTAKRRAPGALDELRGWQADHLGLHGYEALRRELDARFEQRRVHLELFPPGSGRPRPRCSSGR